MKLNIYIFVNLLISSNCFTLIMNNMPKNTNWNTFQFTLKERARNWFINNAEKKGIPWNSITKIYKNDIDVIKSNKYMKENKNIEYPKYFLKPFHGYDDGNMNWMAAIETPAATLGIASDYWKYIDPYTAQDWMRNNITKNIIEYIQDYNNIYNYSPMKALDVGCSVGISTEYLQQSFQKTKFYGIDLSPYFISVAKYRADQKKMSIEYQHENAEKTSFSSKFFDLIICNFVYHELPEKAAKDILHELYRLLSNNGVLAIVDMDPKHLKTKLDNNIFRKWAFESTEPHIYDYYLRNTTEMMKNAQFKNIVKMKNDPLNSIWLGVKRSDKYITKDVLTNRFPQGLEELQQEFNNYKNIEYDFDYELN